MNTKDENQDIVQSAAYNPFPEPQTIPSGWDLSGFTSTPQGESDVEKDDSAERQKK
jgi:hypothetical protein